MAPKNQQQQSSAREFARAFALALTGQQTEFKKVGSTVAEGMQDSFAQGGAAGGIGFSALSSALRATGTGGGVASAALAGFGQAGFAGGAVGAGGALLNAGVGMLNQAGQGQLDALSRSGLFASQDRINLERQVASRESAAAMGLGAEKITRGIDDTLGTNLTNKLFPGETPSERIQRLEQARSMRVEPEERTQQQMINWFGPAAASGYNYSDAVISGVHDQLLEQNRKRVAMERKIIEGSYRTNDAAGSPGFHNQYGR